MTESVSPTQAQSLLKILEKDRNLSNHLVKLLTEERESLEQRQFSTYSEILVRKQRTLVDLESTDSQRRQLMTNMGFSPDNKGFISFLQKIPKPWQRKFSQIWEQLSQYLKQCDDLNKINGKILLHSQIAIDRLMGLIKGQQPTQSTYTKSGRSGPVEANRILASA